MIARVEGVRDLGVPSEPGCGSDGPPSCTDDRNCGAGEACANKLEGSPEFGRECVTIVEGLKAERACPSVGARPGEGGASADEPVHANLVSRAAGGATGERARVRS